MNDVFNCPICWLKYNKTIRIPITLSCGHVICKLCIKTIMINSNTLICSLDKSHIIIDQKNLPICYTILDNLKEDEITDFCCKHHPNKKIKYFCYFDNQTFCSKCLLKHKNNPHNSEKFFPLKSAIETEINLIKKNIEEKQIELSIQNKRLSEVKQSVVDECKLQSEILESEFNYIMTSFKKIKISLDDQLKIYCKNQIENIDDTKKSFNSELNNLNKMLFSTMKLSKSLEGNNILYDELQENKKIIIKDWEIFIKQHKTIPNNYVIPYIRFDKTKIKDIENNLFVFTTKYINEDKSDFNSLKINNNLMNSKTNTNTTASNSKSSSIRRVNSHDSNEIKKSIGNMQILSTPLNKNNLNNFNSCNNIKNKIINSYGTNSNNGNSKNINSPKNINDLENMNTINREFQITNPNNYNTKNSLKPNNLCINTNFNCKSNLVSNIKFNKTNSLNSNNFLINNVNSNIRSKTPKAAPYAKNKFNFPNNDQNNKNLDLNNIFIQNLENCVYTPKAEENIFKNIKENYGVSTSINNITKSNNYISKISDKNENLKINVDKNNNNQNKIIKRIINSNTIDDSNNSIRDIIKNIGERHYLPSSRNLINVKPSFLKINEKLNKKNSENVNYIIKFRDQ